MLTAVGSASGEAWLWMLMKPGATNSPRASISFAAGRRRQVADRDDESVADADVGVEARIAAAVEDGAVPDDGVERRRLGNARPHRPAT